MTKRTPKDYAIEFGGYLADAADVVCNLVANPAPHPDEVADAYSGLRSAAYEFRKRKERAAMPAQLKWTDQSPPNKDCHYNHIIADTPLGKITLEWKGWKDRDAPCGHMPWGEFILGCDLAEAKANAQVAWDAMVARLEAFSGA